MSVKTLRDFEKELRTKIVNGAGIVVTNFGKMKNYKKKIEIKKNRFYNL